MSPEGALFVDVRASRGAGAPFVVEAKFEARPGITILFGPSGSGKSTLLAALAGLLRPLAGTIRLGDRVWFDHAAGLYLPAERRRVAYVFQGLALFPHMTAEANVEYGIERTVPKEERHARARACLERFRVGHLAGRKPRTFSGGEAQRVALARAFAMQPHVVLLDEPFSAMDRDLRRSFATDVRALADELRVPVLHVTHHRNEARAMGDRVILLGEGRIVREGSVAEVLPAEADDEP